MVSTTTITMRATDQTPEHYHRYDGEIVEVPADMWVPVGPGTLYGIPGIFRGNIFEITDDLPPPPPDPGPPWARALAAQLEEIKSLLVAEKDTRG